MNSSASMAQQGKINENASIKDRHSIIIQQPIDHVWSLITDISRWTEWNANISNVSIDGTIAAGTSFKFRIGRMMTHSQIQLFEAPHSFSWTGKNALVKRIYTWSLEKDDDQTIITVATSLQGVFTVLIENHRSVYNELINWLESLKIKAEEGPL